MQGQKNTYKIKIFRIHIQRIVTGEQKQKRQKIQKTDTDTDNTYRKEDRNNKNRRKKITETENIDRRTKNKENRRYIIQKQQIQKGGQKQKKLKKQITETENVDKRTETIEIENAEYKYREQRQEDSINKNRKYRIYNMLRLETELNSNKSYKNILQIRTIETGGQKMTGMETYGHKLRDQNKETESDKDIGAETQ